MERMEMKEQKSSLEKPLFETDIKKENPVLEHNTVFFLVTALIYSICFGVAFYDNYVGITFPLITMATLVVCGLFLKKSEIVWKRKNLYYIIPVVLLGISTMLTTNGFTVFFNTVGILLLITVFMIQQVYPDRKWNIGQYICNMLFLYISMIPEIAAPFVNLGKYIRRKRINRDKNTNLSYVIRGILIGFPMLLFVMILLNSADAIFSKYIGGGVRFLCKNILFSSNIVCVVVLMIVGFFGIYTFLSALTLNNMPEWQKKKEKKNPITAVTFIGMITVVYLIFSIIQVVFLFSGGMILPEGYTYAEYAHQGFFQLLFLCIFNLVMVLCCITMFQMSKLLKTVLMIFSGCTYVMIISSAYRMILYIATYHLTFLRVLVLWFLVLLAVLMAGVIYNIQKKEFPLFRYGIAVVTMFYLALSFSHFDYWIAKYNISQIEKQVRCSFDDAEYLCRNLSLDAVPALVELKTEHFHRDGVQDENGRYWECPACEMERYLEWVEKNTKVGMRSFNLSKYQAVKAITH